ncbi:MAG: MBL fold metallo-hydrolase [Chitinophagaceae bacterium]|nr:MBL fold metallo-hydrolase [Chitinophagaceae bacterium]
MKLHTINTGLFKLDGGAMHGVVPKSMWNKVNPADDNNMCSWAMRCLLIEDGNKLILIDTGMGNKQNEKFFSHYYPHGDDSLQKSLQQLGFTNKDITDVFLTHLHFDHCGGAVIREGEQLKPAFTNATYWSNEKHWQSAIQPNVREKASFLKENMLPLQESGQLKFISSETSSELSDHIDILTVNGHTESMMLPLIRLNGKSILYCADLVPSMAHVSLPWVMAYDMQPLQTLQEKELILQKAADQQWLLFLEHDLHNECCSLEQTEKGIRSAEVFRMSEIQ